MKRFLVFLLSIAVIISCFACGEKNEHNEQQAEEIQNAESPAQDLEQPPAAPQEVKKYTIGETAETDKYSVTFIDCIVVDEDLGGNWTA